MRVSTILLCCLLLPLAACRADSPGDASTRSITVPGEARIRATPDRATLHLAVESRADTAAAAQQQTRASMQKLQSLLESLAIPDSGIQSTQLTVSPETRWDHGKSTVTGYRARWPITVTLDDLGKLGELTDRAVALGVNSVGAPTLEVSKRRELYRQALAAAARDARANAQVLAKTLDGELGSLLELNVADNGGGPRPMTVRASASGPENYQPGQLSISVHLSARFALH